MNESFRDRPSTFDAHGSRIPLYPAQVRGIWRKRRTIVHTILLLFLLLTPWIKVGQYPLIFLDVIEGHFHIFGLNFKAHNAPIVFLVLGIFAIGLAILTATLGRAWCGWACPQTVFLDGVIRRIEYWTEGSHLQRKALDEAPLSFSKIWKKSLKWSLYIAFVIVLTHTFLAYFFGVDRVFDMVSHSPYEHPKQFAFIVVISALILFDMTWFREQFCLIVCPYGRIQSVLMDTNTVSVQYDSARGEPRRAKGLASHGACVACNRCVSVCPTGIDIRNGVQMECIACTACIDACDDVMTKTGQPTGLIRHATQTLQPTQLLRPKLFLYSAVMMVLIVALGFVLSTRKDLDFSLLRAIGAPASERTETDGTRFVTNGYRLHAMNSTNQPLHVDLFIAQTPVEGLRLIAPEPLLTLKPDESRMIPFAIEVPKQNLSAHGGSIKVTLSIQGQPAEVDFVIP